MVSIEEIQAAYYMVAATGVLVAAGYYVLNMRATRKTQELTLKSQEQTLETRQTQLFMQIYMRYFEDDLFGKNYWTLMGREWNDSDDYVEKYGGRGKPPKIPDGGDLNKMMTFYEGVAVLVERKMIDVSLVYELMPTNVTAFWAKYGPLIMFARSHGSPRNLYRLVENLSNTIAGYAKARGDPVVTEYASRAVTLAQASSKAQ